MEIRTAQAALFEMADECRRSAAADSEMRAKLLADANDLSKRIAMSKAEADSYEAAAQKLAGLSS